MTIEIRQLRLEELIEQRMASGQFESVKDLLLQTLEGTSVTQARNDPGHPQTKLKPQNLADFLLNSPLHGSGIVVDRSKDAPQVIEF